MVLDEGRDRTPRFVTLSQADGVDIAKRVVDRLAVIHTDEASHRDALHAGWQVKRINPSEAYSADDSCTN